MACKSYVLELLFYPIYLNIILVWFIALMKTKRVNCISNWCFDLLMHQLLIVEKLYLDLIMKDKCWVNMLKSTMKLFLKRIIVGISLDSLKDNKIIEYIYWECRRLRLKLWGTVSKLTFVVLNPSMYCCLWLDHV